MAKPTVSATFDSNYRPHDYLRGTIEGTKDYRLPCEQVRIATPDTGVIVALILYIIAREPTVNRTKLECYIILLNHMIKDTTGSELFTWTLNRSGRISNFSRFFNFMEGKGLLQPNGRFNFAILGYTKNTQSRLETILRNLLPCLSILLSKYKESTATAMLEEI